MVDECPCITENTACAMGDAGPNALPQCGNSLCPPPAQPPLLPSDCQDPRECENS